MTPKPEDKPRVLRKVALANFKDKKILMVRDNTNDSVFYFLGGKVEAGETDEQALEREVKEELEVNLDMTTVKFLKEFESPAYGKENALVNIRLFTGDFTGTPQCTEEIVDFRYMDSSATSEELTSIATEEAFPWLKKQGYIN